MAVLAIGSIGVSNCLIAPTRTRRLLHLGLSLPKPHPSAAAISEMNSTLDAFCGLGKIARFIEATASRSLAPQQWLSRRRLARRGWLLLG